MSPSHECQMWCNQLMHPLSRALYEPSLSAVYHHFENSTSKPTQGLKVAQGPAASKLGAAEKQVPLAPDSYNHAAVFMGAARQHLLSRALPHRLQALLDQPYLTVHGAEQDGGHEKSGSNKAAPCAHKQQCASKPLRAEPSSSQQDSCGWVDALPQHTLNDALSALDGLHCTGANLMWYAQYVRPITVSGSKHKGLLRLHGGSGAKKVSRRGSIMKQQQMTLQK